jgi:hypothetical protein
MVYGGGIGARLFRWHQRDKNLGGNSLFRSEERIATSSASGRPTSGSKPTRARTVSRWTHRAANR